MKFALAALALASLATAQVTVGEVHWGFDGRVVAERFNLLSVRVDNAGTEPFDGELRWWRTAEFMPMRLGAELVESCFVAPGSSRWVALHPFIVDDGTRWTLRLGRERTILDAPRPGEPAIVYVTDDRSWRAARATLPLFPAARFPASVVGTDGLAAVVMADRPDWDGPRRAAFRQWVHKGGRVHLLARSGRHPQFGGDLAMLDGDEPRTRHGAGVVIREPAGVRATDAERFRSTPRPQPFADPGATSRLLSSLKLAISNQHDWPLILLCAVLYLFAIGPVHWFLAARKLNTLTALVTFVAIVAGFGFLMHVLGRRGADEMATDHSLVYARAIEADRLELLLFTDVFATTGDRYRIGAGEGATLFSTAQLSEAVPAIIRHGGDATLDVDIPLYSHRGIVSATTVRGRAPTVELADWPAQPGELSFRIDQDRAVATLTALALWRGEAHVLARRGPTLQATGETNEVRFSNDVVRRSSVAQGQGKGAPPPPESLIAFAIPAELPRRDDHIDVLILESAPPGVGLRGTGAASRRAFVIHHLQFDRDRNR